jgi:hypothetical protein
VRCIPSGPPRKKAPPLAGRGAKTVKIDQPNVTASGTFSNSGKPLAFPLHACGFLHELVERSGMVCLVKRSRIGNDHWHYEVVKLIPYPDQVRFGTLVPAHECYPSNEHWGTYGFTYRPEEFSEARARFTSMAAVLYGEPKTRDKNAQPVLCKANGQGGGL